MPGAEYLRTGFPGCNKAGAMFLKSVTDRTTFEDGFLQNHIKLPSKNCLVKTCNSNEPFYFCYYNEIDSIQASIIFFSRLAGSSDKDITIVSSCRESYIENLEEEIHNVWKDIASNLNNSVKT